MLITIDTVQHTAEVLNEDTKDWEPAHIKDMRFEVSCDTVPVFGTTIDIPTHITHTLDVDVILPSKR